MITGIRAVNRIAVAVIGLRRLIIGFSVEKCECGDAGSEYSHRIGVLRCETKDIENHGRKSPLRSQSDAEIGQFGCRRKSRIPEQECDFFEAGIPGQVCYIISRIHEFSFHTVDETDIGIKGNDSLQSASFDGFSFAGIRHVASSINQVQVVWRSEILSPVGGTNPNQNKVPRSGRIVAGKIKKTDYGQVDSITSGSFSRRCVSRGLRIELRHHQRK